MLVTARLIDSVTRALARRANKSSRSWRADKSSRSSRVASRGVIRGAMLRGGARTRDDLVRGAIARAIDLSLEREDFRIIHVGVRAARLELIVEAADQYALARGMQGFQVSAARSLNREARRTGSVFPDRYRARVIATRPALAATLARLPGVARRRIGAPESPLFAISRFTPRRAIT